jgi:hypothetical protein
MRHQRPIHATATLILILTISAISLLASEPTGREAPDKPAANERPAIKQRRREGDLFQAPGRFESTGDRITFYADEGEEVFRVLENLALERIARVLEDPSGLGGSRKWNVTGVVTEYRGSNYLLIERAILKAR